MNIKLHFPLKMKLEGWINIYGNSRMTLLAQVVRCYEQQTRLITNAVQNRMDGEV